MNSELPKHTRGDRDVPNSGTFSVEKSIQTNKKVEAPGVSNTTYPRNAPNISKHHRCDNDIPRYGL